MWIVKSADDGGVEGVGSCYGAVVDVCNRIYHVISFIYNIIICFQVFISWFFQLFFPSQ